MVRVLTRPHAKEKVRSGLLQAVRAGDAAAVAQCLQRGDNPDLQDVEGRTSLMYAVDSGALAIVRALIAQGADIMIEDRLGRTALDMALRSGCADLVEPFEKPLKDLLLRLPPAHSSDNDHLR